jgi:hypothetical protein
MEEIDTNASDLELLVAVLEHWSLWKKAGPILEARPPSETGARFLLAQYKKGACAPWAAAYLLGCVRHELGYTTVLQILLDGPGRIAKSYAGVALAKINPDRASEDLLNVLKESPHRKSREGAAYGLGTLPLTEDIARTLFYAALNHKVSSGPVASALGKGAEESGMMLEYIADMLTTPLDSIDDERRRLVTDVAWDTFHYVGRFRQRETLMNRLRPSVAEILNDPEFRMHPIKRKKLNDWLQRCRAG